ncbi:hypothetical protein [Shewanella gaetbuli]
MTGKLIRQSEFKLFFVVTILVSLITFWCGQTIAAEDKPWTIGGKLYTELDEQVQNSEEGDQTTLNKWNRWSACSMMAPSTYRMALTVKVVKENQGNLDEIRELFEDEYPINEGYFQDVINKKKIELAFEMADLSKWEESNKESPITQAAWDWCIALDPENFEEL